MKIILSLFLCAVIFSCSSSPKKDEQKQYKCTKYGCPMHPDKTNTAPASCPDCNMDMMPVDSVLVDSTVTESCCKKAQVNKS